MSWNQTNIKPTLHLFGYWKLKCFFSKDKIKPDACCKENYTKIILKLKYWTFSFWDYLKERRRNDIEKLLAIFDQSHKVDNDNQIINLNEEDFPEKYKEIIRRLVKANSEPEIRRKMDLEDDLIDEIRNKDLAIKRRDEELEKKDEEHKKKMLEMARFLKQLKIDIRTIIDKTGLSHDEIKKV